MHKWIFERLVIQLLIDMVYGASIEETGQTIGKWGDEGIDGVIKEDVLSLDVLYIHAKKWDGIIGRPEIQKFAGALQGQRKEIKKEFLLLQEIFLKMLKNIQTR